MTCSRCRERGAPVQCEEHEGRHPFDPETCVGAVHDAATPSGSPALTMIVNGTAQRVPFTKGETVGVLAHRALAADGYGWTEYELRDEAGSLLMERTPAVDGETVYIAKPIGWGG